MVSRADRDSIQAGELECFPEHAIFQTIDGENLFFTSIHFKNTLYAHIHLRIILQFICTGPKK